MEEEIMRIKESREKAKVFSWLVISKVVEEPGARFDS